MSEMVSLSDSDPEEHTCETNRKRRRTTGATGGGKKQTQMKNKESTPPNYIDEEETDITALFDYVNRQNNQYSQFLEKIKVLEGCIKEDNEIDEDVKQFYKMSSIILELNFEIEKELKNVGAKCDLLEGELRQKNVPKLKETMNSLKKSQQYVFDEIMKDKKIPEDCEQLFPEEKTRQQENPIATQRDPLFDEFLEYFASYKELTIKSVPAIRDNYLLNVPEPLFPPNAVRLAIARNHVSQDLRDQYEENVERLKLRSSQLVKLIITFHHGRYCTAEQRKIVANEIKEKFTAVQEKCQNHRDHMNAIITFKKINQRYAQNLQEAREYEAWIEENRGSMLKMRDALDAALHTTVQRECTICTLVFTDGESSSNPPMIAVCGHSMCKPCILQAEKANRCFFCCDPATSLKTSKFNYALMPK